MYKCKTCNNNSCNGTYGVIDGDFCKNCPKVYELSKNDDNKFIYFIEYAVYLKRKLNIVIGNLIFNVKEKLK